MKITDKDFKDLKEAIENTPLYLRPDKEEYRSKGYSSMRYRWDWFWRSNFNPSKLYKYLNDDNIDTALRKLCQYF
jgi:hypothetical protein